MLLTSPISAGILLPATCLNYLLQLVLHRHYTESDGFIRTSKTLALPGGTHAKSLNQ